ncbi:MAG: RNA ligase family protein [Gemmataceae bacterium]|nr:RNA ligase family protein [Gemmataceae bacterium]
MKPYPSITNVPDEYLGRACVAFAKLDGSNLRFLWRKKEGWCRFGTRTRLLDPVDPEFGPALGVFRERLADPIAAADAERWRPEEFIVYAEWFGPHSFAGEHDAARLGVACNEPKSLVPFDLSIHKRGMLPPDGFLATLAEAVPVAPVAHRGPFDAAFIERVREEGEGEGVIAKGCEGKPPHGLWMCKVKARRWLDELRRRHGGDWERLA